MPKVLVETDEPVKAVFSTAGGVVELPLRDDLLPFINDDMQRRLARRR